MSASDLRQKTAAELKLELDTLLREQFNLRMQKGTGQLSRPDQVKKVRRNIARIKTVLNEKAKAGEAA
jgi:large subunit ribosomal protein L29